MEHFLTYNLIFAAFFRLPALVCRHAHLQQQLQKEETQLLYPIDPITDVVSDSELSQISSSTSAGLHECDTAGTGAEAAGVTHVGILRAGAARQVVAALADGQLLLYRENGKQLLLYRDSGKQLSLYRVNNCTLCLPSVLHDSARCLLKMLQSFVSPSVMLGLP